MSRAQLIPCRSCARHVRVTDHACPFCGGAVQKARVAPGVPVPQSNMSRAALFAIGAAAAAAAAVGCSGQTVPADGAVSDASADALAADASTDAPADVVTPIDARPDVFLVDAAYGGPPPKDAGPDTNNQPPYGTPPPPDDAGMKTLYGAPPPN